MKLQERYNAFFDKKTIQRALFWLFLAFGVFARVYRFGAVPAGLNQDEAFAGYEAWSLLNYGIDLYGYHNPVYLAAWGSGMNALETYLMMPFIALFGLEVWVIRLPQLIVGCLSLWVSYLLIKRTVNVRAALFALLMLSICPWHIIMSRWGLESNLAPGFLLFGLYFFVRGTDNPRFLPLSALMYGLSLYAYATVWPYVPFIILVQLVYCMVLKKIRFGRHLVLSGLILAVLAAPLLLFLAVNYGYIDEIKTSLISVPRLENLRAGELSLSNLSEKFKLLKYIYIYQTDNCIWNSPTKYGLFYYITMPFAVIGLVYVISRGVSCARRREFCPELLLLVQPLISLPHLLLIEAQHINHINIVLLPLVLMAALGVYCLSLISFRWLLGALAAVYIVLFAGFEQYYFTEYTVETHSHFSYGLSDALDFAEDKGGRLYFGEYEVYIKVLFYEHFPVDEFRKTLKYYYIDTESFPSEMKVYTSFDRFYFVENPCGYIDDSAAYVIQKSTDISALTDAGFKTEAFGEYIVAYKD